MAEYLAKKEPFDNSAETWASYIERLEQYFILNKIKKDQQVAALFSLFGRKAYGLLRNLTAPAKPAAKTYKEIIEFKVRQAVITETINIRREV